MSRQIQNRRGTAAEHENFTGAPGEITVNTTTNTLHIHDGVTLGGTVLARAGDLSAYRTALEQNTIDNTKLNVDLTNITNTGLENITRHIIPSFNSVVVLASGALPGTSITIQQTGVLAITAVGSNANNYVQFYANSRLFRTWWSDSLVLLYLFIRKGTVLTSISGNGVSKFGTTPMMVLLPVDE